MGEGTGAPAGRVSGRERSWCGGSVQNPGPCLAPRDPLSPESPPKGCSVQGMSWPLPAPSSRTLFPGSLLPGHAHQHLSFALLLGPERGGLGLPCSLLCPGLAWRTCLD